MTHFIAKASFAAIIALASVPFGAPTASASQWGRAPVVDVQYRPAYACSPVQAVQKARWTGLRYARVTTVTPRRVVVSGRNYRGWDRMVFANVRGCPLIRR
ncbi:hypothetical protein SAMN05216228_100551 [Rhizobium tibeticum]|uniref:Antifreeze protein n=1 Tax=Rhizobium tibeticum TaxID=501024 RepID=A0A1H8H5B1_9HYPH|nr:hypothetical protein [Rhizobium tibeticum]SEH64450.1 hypothetical protein RTCCBAU85039_1559 [Rhizobium tibeticum]SEN51426.1 hypothetical protein SAMN05216228_100551 [Rhizobium tibeticum]